MSCCPLCDSKVGKLKVMFVKYVTSSKENMESYLRKELTFESWKNELENGLRELK